MQIDRVISLGGDCEVAAQARRATGSDRAYPLDWWTVPIDTVPSLLTSRFRHVFDVEQISKRNDVVPVLDSSFARTTHIHEFPYGEDFLSYDLETISRRLKEKYVFLSARFFRDCAEGTTLFVRRKVIYDPPESDRLARSVSELCQVIETFCPAWHLLLVNYEPGLSSSDRVLQRTVTRYDDAHHLGSDRGWDEMLATLPFSLVRHGASPRLFDLKSTAGPALSRWERLERFWIARRQKLEESLQRWRREGASAG